MIPANIDHIQVLADLNGWGYRDYRIEAICGFSIGYVAHLKGSGGGVTRMSYDRAARLYNFWFEEQATRVPHETERIQSAVLTTT